ncbi:hypothetical protein LKO27_10075 [Tessaracoccus sp. OS52]|uniref:asparagine synthase-related protein n=1 Tax=Tessaracoccus sp. OS52 TaxID=2886691 RepID=UPI001D0FDF1C|nr:asparagine synthase-related protein [Tessaracoccus sp. OS52]MCC2593751.1 hypothetical protein [Tessaracoccus sp. OS52]
MKRPALADAYVRSSPLEVATGWVYGLLPATPLPKTSLTPRQALDDVIRPALEEAPCFVTFSGGRDSSAILAAATSLARREGHELPIPVTRIYPNVPDSDESDWQRLVLDHLGIREWVRLEFAGDETDLLGEAARVELLSHGVVWPAALHTQPATYSRLQKGSMLTGEGGDLALGLRRGTALTVLRNGRRPTRGLILQAATSLMPRPVRRLDFSRAASRETTMSWLTPSAVREHFRRAADDEVAEPLRYDAGTWFLTRRRFWSVLSHNQSMEAARYGLRIHDPLLNPHFLAALAHSGGRWGYNGRTATMRALFSDVLPPQLISRPTKAAFNHAYRGDTTQRFARSWDGSGVDTDLVDVERLREMWLSEHPTMATGLLLQTAWLASGGKTP